MSTSMRVFCFLAVVALLAAASWLYFQGMSSQAFIAVCMAYLPLYFALLGEVWVPTSKSLSRRPYQGETRAELIRRELADLEKLSPKRPSRYQLLLLGAVGGLLVWIALCALIATLAFN